MTIDETRELFDRHAEIRRLNNAIVARERTNEADVARRDALLGEYVRALLAVKIDESPRPKKRRRLTRKAKRA